MARTPQFNIHNGVKKTLKKGIKTVTMRENFEYISWWSPLYTWTQSDPSLWPGATGGNGARHAVPPSKDTVVDDSAGPLEQKRGGARRWKEGEDLD